MDHWDLKATPWDNHPMFHPPGQHPANRMDRAVLREFEELGALGTPEGQYLLEKVAAFEGRESEVKAIYYYRLKENDERLP